MAEPFKVRVGDLLFELPAHTPGIVRPLPAAGAVAAGPFQPLLYGVYHVRVGI